MTTPEQHAHYNRSAKGRARTLRYHRSAKGQASRERYNWKRIHQRMDESIANKEDLIRQITEAYPDIARLVFP